MKHGYIEQNQISDKVLYEYRGEASAIIYKIFKPLKKRSLNLINNSDLRHGYWMFVTKKLKNSRKWTLGLVGMLCLSYSFRGLSLWKLKTEGLVRSNGKNNMIICR